MKRKRILVTGGAGYIGSHTVVELVRAGYDPVIVDNFSNAPVSVIHRLERLAGRKFVVHRADCTSAPAMGRVFRREKGLAGVIHFAALKNVAESVARPLHYYRHNMGGMAVVLEAALAHGLRHFVFSSSCTVYGNPLRLPVRETTPLSLAVSPYGEIKRASEALLEAVVKSGAPLNGVSIRYFNPVGAHPSGLIGESPAGRPNNLVPLLMQAAARRGRLVIFGDDHPTPDGTCIRDYIHVADLARAHIRALEYLKMHPAGGCYDVFNIGLGRGYSVRQVIDLFEEVAQVPVNCVVGRRRPGDVEKIYANVDKAKKILGWRAELSMKEALTHAWAWQKKRR